METLIIFITGILFGSFFNVVGLRVPMHESILYPPSHCPGCKKKLKPWDLIPILSFLFKKGRCTYCQKRISPIYPIIEALTGVLFVIAFFQYGLSWQFVYVILFISLFMIITVSDIFYQIIPDKILLPFFVVFLLFLFFMPQFQIGSHLLGMILGFVIFYLIAVVSNGGMGGGDIKLFALSGLVLGTPLLFLSILLATVSGSIYGLLFILFKGGNRKSKIPFGPFIAAGCLIAILWGERILNWYWNQLS
jgi:prepilin signal peptidase PulO-like enzyme (type II secretory pathway)